VSHFTKAIEDLKQSKLDLSELEDRDAQALLELAEAKRKKDEDVIHQRGLEQADADSAESSAKVIDLMEVLRKSLSKDAVVSHAGAGEPISLAERRAKKTPAKRKASATSKASRKRARR
jgi:non-homologous end joining protein Ku